ncbi:MAG: hypothetical protein M3041_07490 [Acidobacteriota bacterium]|nr:hypothetical protein [Acidobacteriota bacterium]
MMSVESSIASLDTNVVELRDDTLSHFDGVYRRFDQLESEYQALSAAVKRIEEQHQREN